MLQALIHIGLSALLVVAPALCCCNVRLLAGQIAALSEQQASCPDCPQPAPPPVPSCCQTEKPAAKPVKKASCCHEAQSPSSDSKSAPAKPAQPKPSRCDFCGERLEATTPEIAPSVASPKPTGELIPFAFLAIAAVAPEHLGLLGGLKPPERAGVDTRFTTLFEHHVLRC